jgi:hypothetical protein
MVTDYVLFIHGVNTREEREKATYADNLFRLIEEKVNDTESTLPLTLKSIPLYWGDVNIVAEQTLLSTLQDSPDWKHLWFREFREKQILQFAGDAALYISRYVGSQVVQQLAEQSQKMLKGWQPKDRLHLVTHSWGTVILFDVLFAARWDEDKIPGYPYARAIRDFVFGVEPNPEKGIRLSSIHTMGSPVALFSLIDVKENPTGTNVNTPNITNTHDITPRLEELLENLYQSLGKKLLWKNFIHPGDPVAYPLATLMTQLVDGNGKYLDVQDVVMHNKELFDFFTQAVSQSVLALLHGGDAHSNYWKSEEVARTIAQTIRRSAKQTVA